MVSLEEKVEALGLQRIDINPLLIAEVYQVSLINPSKVLSYYKTYGENIMYYSNEYLESTSIEQLLMKDVCNQF